MAAHGTRTTRFSVRLRALLVGAAVSSLALVALTVLPTSALGEGPPVGLGTAAQYSVVGGQAVTNTGPSVLAAGLALSPGTAVTGFPPGIVNGPVQVDNAVAAQVQADLVAAYNDAAGRATDASVATDLGGLSLAPGTYTSSGPSALTGTLTLDAQGDKDAVFIFQIASTLTTASSSSVSLVNGATACNVFWQVGSSATLGTASNFVGTVMALTSITATTGATVSGRLLARNGAVTLDSNVFEDPRCDGDGGATTPPVSTPVDSTATETPTVGATTDTAVTDTPTTEPTGTDTPTVGTTTESTGTDTPVSEPTVTETTAIDTTVTETTGPTSPSGSTGSSSNPETTAPATGTTPATGTGTGIGTSDSPVPEMTEPTPPTTTATAEPQPPRGDGSPPLAYTATSSATIPAFLLGIAFLAAGAGALLLGRVRRGAGRRGSS